jgi:Fe-S cluster assembly protein SufD
MEAIAAEPGFVPAFVASAHPDWVEALRRAAFERFEKLGFPAPGDEAWRYTGIQPIVGTPWVAAAAAPPPGPQPSPPMPFADAAVFSNGRLVRPHPALPRGVRVESLRGALARDPETLRNHLGRLASFQASAFTALNTAALDEVAVISTERGAVVENPIPIVFASQAGETPTVSSPRTLILAGERSQCSVVETYTGDGRYFTNAVTEILLADGAVVEHSKLQRESEAACHVHAIAARLNRGSRFTSHNVALGGALARTDLAVVLAAEGAECELNGLFVGKGTQHLDNHTLIDHAEPHGVSRELYKGIMDGSSRGVFHGTIIVRPGAQKTDAIQTNKNLLLSRHALVDSTPALEIFADDVKCRHGATTGQLDPAALFYLRSRGIGEEDARALLTYAFASDLAGRIRVPELRAAVEAELGLRLAGGSSREEARP